MLSKSISPFETASALGGGQASRSRGCRSERIVTLCETEEFAMTLGDLVPFGRKDREVGRQTDTFRRESSELSPFLSLHREMNRLFDDAFRDFGVLGSQTPAWPHVELTETDDGYKLTAELPGIDEKDVELSLHDGVLTLRGERRSEQDDQRRGYTERYYGSFTRSIAVGDVDEEKVNATFDKACSP
jgi:HSP20 family protein